MAWQTVYHNESNNTDSEYVNFEHRDASGLSYRSTTAAGTAITGGGAEGSPAELDPLGGNVGLSTPYLSFNNPPPLIQPEYPSLFVRAEDAPMYVNGQQVSCSLDGLAVGCGMAFAALSNGSAVPSDVVQFNNTVFGLGLGGSYVEIPGGSSGGGQATISGGTTVSGTVNVFAQSSTFIFVPSYSTISWNTRQAQQPPPQTAGGGGGGGDKNGLNTGNKAVFSLDQLKKCLSVLGEITIKEFSFNRASEGSFSADLKVDNKNSVLNSVLPLIQLQTSTNVRSRDSRDLAVFYNNTLEPGQQRYSNQSGFTLYERPKTNWIATDVGSNTKLYTNIGVLGLFIHELGNSIGVQLWGKSAINSFGLNGLNNNDKDFGTNLENCVFGGIVGLRSGKVGSNREF